MFFVYFYTFYSALNNWWNYLHLFYLLENPHSIRLIKSDEMRI